MWNPPCPKYMSRRIAGPRDRLLLALAGFLRHDGKRVADAVLRFVVGQVRDRQARPQPAVGIATVHRVRAGCEGFALAAAVRRVAGRSCRTRHWR